MICPHCNAALPDGARFCNSCGNATAGTEPHSNPDLGKETSMIGREIAGRYRILAKLGEGGMGTVFRAEQISLKRTVAVKLLRPDVSSNPLILRRFDAEATAVGKLSHPNTVNIYDFGRDTDGSLFIAMELIEGRSLRNVVASEAPLQVGRALAIASQVAASLADAHGHAIIHRDLKPDNVMLQDRGRERDVVRVLDFGIAKLRDETQATQAALTKAGDVLGTPQYMAPEQIRGENIDGRTDIYALGCMVYEMVTGRLPFEAATIMAIMSKHLMESAPPPSARRPDLRIPVAIDQLVMTAMAKDANARWPTMEQFGEHIAAVLASLPPDQRPQPKMSAPVSAPMSAALAVATPPPALVTPPAYSMTPPHAQGAPQHAQPSPQHGQVAPYHPPPQAPFGSAPTPPPSFVQPSYPAHRPAKSRTLMWVGISAAAILSVGLIAWGMGGPKKDEPIFHVDHGSGDPKGDPFDDDHKDHKDRKEDPPPPPPPANGELPRGAHLIPPEGWSEVAAASPQGHEIMNNQFPTARVAMAVLPASFDKNTFVTMAKKNGAQFQSQTQVMSAGAMRDALVFQNMANGVLVGQVMVFYPSRIFVFAQIPAELLNQPGFNESAAQFWANNVIVP